MKMKYLFIYLILCLWSDLFSQNFEWARSNVSSTVQEANAVAHDGNGDFYIIGYANSNTFIVKYSPANEILWTKNFEGAQIKGIDITVDAENNVIVIGVFYYSLTIGGVTLAGSEGSGPSGKRAFIAKFNSEGSFIFARKIEITHDYSSGNLRVLGIDTDEEGNIFVVGNSDHDFQIGGTIYPSENGSVFDDEISFVVKFNPTGGVVWLTRLDPADNSFVWIGDIVVNETGVFTVGRIGSGAIDIEGDSYTSSIGWAAAIIKLDLNGVLDWVLPYHENGQAKFGTIASDDKNNIYTLGWVRDEGVNFTHIVLKVHPTGEILYVKHLDKEVEDLTVTVFDYGRKIGGLYVAENNLYYAGGFRGYFSVDFINYNSGYKNISLLNCNCLRGLILR